MPRRRKAALASTTISEASTDDDSLKKWKEFILETLGGPDGSFPPCSLHPCLVIPVRDV
ncbi:hypothetical protein J3R82DRAFT_11914 [Butyriboletus roseoflavus]|nr:hypothetical protein J3R82DRAFT_11914 [Butyriboletus roseoflavus]